MTEQLWTLSPTNRRRLAIESYVDVHARALEVVRSAPSGLIFVHYPIPHAPFIYDGNAERFVHLEAPGVAGYLDNLRLADRALRELLVAISDSGRSEETTLIVSSDHSWRDAPRYGLVRDLRVPFILRLARSREAHSLDRPFDTLHSARLVEAVLTERLRTPEEVEAWVATLSDPPQSHPDRRDP